MEKKEHTPHDYSVDEILAETRGRFGGKTYAELIGEAEEPVVPERKPAAPAAPAQPSGELPRALSQVYPFDAPPVPTEQAAPAPVQPEKAPKSVPSKTQRPAPQPENRPEPPRQEKPEDSGDNREDLPAEPPRGQEEPQKKKGFWARRRERKKKRQGFDETEDIYYGLQLKGLDEYRRGYNDDDAEQNGPTPAFSYLFDDTQDNDVDEEIAQRFAVIHQERQRRAEAAEFPPAGRRDAIYSYSDQALGAAERNPEARRPNDPIAFPTEEQRKKVLSRRTEIQPPEGRTVEFRMPDRLKAQQPLPRPEQKPQTESFDVDQILSERGFPTRKEMPQKESLDAPVPAPQTAPRKPKKLAVTPLPKEPPTAQRVQPAAQESAPAVQEALPLPQQTEAALAMAEPVPGPSPASPAELPVQETPEMPAAPDLPQEAPAAPVRETPPEKAAPEVPSEPVPAEEKPAQEPDVPAAEPEKHEEPAPEQKPAQPGPAPEKTAAPQEDPQKAERRRKISAMMDAVPAYQPYGRRVHVLDIEDLGAALEAEAQAYAPRTSKKRFLGNIPDEQAELGEEQPQKPEQEVHTASRKGGKFALFGDEEVESPIEDLDKEEEELDDYSQPSDAPSISYELKANIRKVLLRTAVTGIFTVLLLILDLLFTQNLFFPAVESAATTLGFLITNIVFLAAAAIFCLPAIINGWKGLFTLHANSDSAVAVAVFAALLQSAAQFFAQSEVVPGQQVHLYSVLAVGALFLNAAGKLVMVRRIHRNFQFVASSDQKYAVEIYDDYNTSLQMAKGCVVDSPCIAYQHRAGFLKGFLRSSYEVDPAEAASQTIAPIGLGLSVVLCAAVAVLTRDAVSAITAFAAGACVSAPVMNLLCANLPVSRLCRLARRCGTMVTGCQAIDQFSSVNAVMLDAKDLFPKGTVVLNGIKTFGDGRIDDAIMDATVVMSGIGGPLSDLFDQILKTAPDLLPKATNVSYEDGHGVVGWVSGRRILVGNRDLMTAHGVEPPSREYEKKYLTGGKQVIYLASGGKMMATFILTYNSDKRRALELQRMESNGISLIVRTTDPNITPQFLAQCFQLDTQSVRVLPQRLGDVYETLVNTPADRVPAAFASRGRPTAMMRILTACIRQKGNISLAIALQNIAVALGFVLVAFLACFSGLDQLTTPAMLLYQIFWILVILIVPRLRKP